MPLHRSWFYCFAAFGCLNLLLVSCGTPPVSNTTLLATDAPTHMVAIKTDEYAPFIMVVAQGGAVVWQNQDAVAHQIVTTPEQRSYLNLTPINLDLAPGATQTVLFSQPGLYHYYDPTVSDWNQQFGRVAPRKGTPLFPLTMEGMIYVQGAIPNLPDHETNSVAYLHDRVDKNIVAVRQGGMVSFHNFDTDPHFFLPVLGWDAPVNPVDIGLNNLLGANDAPPDGETRAITFTAPGLYYYYCYIHADIDPVRLRAVAHTDASEYPFPMEGWVLVMPG